MTGSITKHKQKNGKISWGYFFRAGKRPDGKWNQVTKQGYETKAEADEALREAITKFETGGAAAVVTDPRTFGEFFDTWIKEHCERNCEASTTEGYIAKGTYAKRFLGNIPITRLTALQIQKALNELRDHGGKITEAEPNGRPLSAKTIREIAAVTGMVLRFGIRLGALDFDPMVRVVLPRSEKKESKILEKANLEWFLAGADGHPWLHLLLLLDAGTGCRRGELLALTWSDIDFDNSELSISKSLAQTPKKGIYLKSPKGRKARKFALSPSTIEALRRHRKAQQKNRDMFAADYRADLDLVFATPEGEYLKPDSVTAKVSRLARKLGFPKGVSLHSLRHSHGSHLLSNGVPLPAVSKRLGHANTHVTATIYSHALEKDDQKSAEAWERSMGDLGKNSGLPKQ